jgi:hypothetical protein
MVLFDLLLFQFLGSQFLGIVLLNARIFSKVSIVNFNGRQDIWLCPVILWVHG